MRGVVDQTRDIILLAFQLTRGSYRLEPGSPAGEAITLDISTPELILEGISQIEAWSRVERGCGGPRDALRGGPRQRGAVQPADARRGPGGARARGQEGPLDVEALCAESVLNHFEVCRTLWAFRVIGLVKRLEETLPLDEDGLEYILPADGA